MQRKDLRSKDVAWLLDIGPDEVVALIHRGELKAKKKGRLWTFTLPDVLACRRRRIAMQAGRLSPCD